MKRTKYLALLPLFALLTATPLVAQKAAKGTATGLQQEANAFRLPTFVKAQIGSDAIITDADGQRLGTVSDHVIEGRSGKVLFVAVAVGQGADARARLVPYSRFVWNTEKMALQLPMTVEELQALPEYDPKTTGGTREAGAKKDKQNFATSELRGSQIMADSESFAALGDLILEPNRGTIAFVLATSEQAKGDPYIVPWQALKWEVSEDEEGYFALSIASDGLAEAPKLERGDTKRLQQKDTLEKIYGFYEVTPPASQAKESGKHQG